MNRQYQFQPIFQRQFFQFQPYQTFQQKMLIRETEAGNFIVVGYQNVYNSNFQNRQLNANVQPRQFTLKYPNLSDFKNLPVRRQSYANVYDPKNRFFERRSFKIYDANQQNRQ